jgi:TonB family protein
MNKKFLIFVLFAFCLSVITLQAFDRLDVKLRVYEGARKGPVDPPQFVTSSYIRPTITASIQRNFELEKEKDQIKRVFNLLDVNLLTEADLGLNVKDPATMRHYFQLNGNEYAAFVRLQEWKQSGEFLILVNEIDEGEHRNVLTTEILLVGGDAAVFGFEDRKGKPYFVSFHITGPKDKLLPKPPPPPPAPPPAIKKKMKEFEKGAVKAVGQIKPPKAVAMVRPVYPEKARKAGIEGVVILSARANEKGNVEEVMVLNSPDPILNKAAVDAVKQWKYEPLIIDDKPIAVIFTVTVRFKLKDRDITEGAVEAGDDVAPPKLIKKVAPVYPEEARKEGLEGVVILSVRANEYGEVEQVKVLKSVPLLDEAAIGAVRKWVYEPYISKGKPTPIVFTVTVKFALDKKKK